MKSHSNIIRNQDLVKEQIKKAPLAFKGMPWRDLYQCSNLIAMQIYYQTKDELSKV